MVIHTNVFQNGAHGGNPCPVIIDGDDLNTEQGKWLATLFAAETIIICNAKDADSDFALRYFVPKYEMEMCIHGTIAAITVLKMIQGISKTSLTIETLPISSSIK